MIAPAPIPMVDVPSLTEDLRRVVHRIVRFAGDATRWISNTARKIRSWVSTWLERYVSGLEARYYVRAAFDPRYADVDDLVRSIRRGRAPGLSFLGPNARTRVALAAMRGWAVHRPADHDDDQEILAWHRQLGGTRVLVGRASA